MLDSVEKTGLNIVYGTWMTTFSTNPYFIIFQGFECYATLLVKELGSPLGPTMANVFLSFYEMK